MVLREDDRGVLAIGQASHAWISGQLARAWGNERFGEIEPREEVCLAAEQHDVGMAAWDLEPTRNPATGLPHSFIEMPIATHISCGALAPAASCRNRAMPRCSSRCTAGACTRCATSRAYSPPTADLIRGFIDSSRSFEHELVTSLEAAAATSSRATAT